MEDNEILRINENERNDNNGQTIKFFKHFYEKKKRKRRETGNF